MSATLDAIVVGGGVLGATVTYHLARRGARVAVLDRGPGGFSATAGNHGLVWAQDKAPSPYLGLTLRSIRRYPDFARELRDLTGLDIEYARPGGLSYSLSEADLAARAAFIAEQSRTRGFAAEMLDARALHDLEPLAGPAVAGGSFCPLDGHANPLALARALHAGIARLGGGIHRRWEGTAIEALGGGGWVVGSAEGPLAAPVLVLAAGVGIERLARLVGLNLPVRPQRGQILVSEPLPPVLRHPSVPARQTRSGNLLLGATHEEVGFDAASTAEGIRQVAASAQRYFPFVARVALVRAWGALRPLSPDGLPILEQPAGWPGFFVVSSHSGITLCPVVGEAVAEWVSAGQRPSFLPVFARSRFRARDPGAIEPAPAGLSLE